MVGAETIDAADPAPADAVIATQAGLTAGIVTADCVPILAGSVGGRAVAAIHAGWRGLAAGVIEAGIDALCAAAGQSPSALACGVGPAARGCCYEVDAPVREALASAYPGHVDSFFEDVRPGYWRLDLSGLATEVLRECGVQGTQIGVAQRSCTICDKSRFESYRREGARAGRLRHFVTTS